MPLYVTCKRSHNNKIVIYRNNYWDNLSSSEICRYRGRSSISNNGEKVDIIGEFLYLAGRSPPWSPPGWARISSAAAWTAAAPGSTVCRWEYCSPEQRLDPEN